MSPNPKAVDTGGAALPAVDPMYCVSRAWAHLNSAISQSLPTDDRIIMEHMREAKALLDAIMQAHRERKEPQPQKAE